LSVCTVLRQDLKARLGGQHAVAASGAAIDAAAAAGAIGATAAGGAIDAAAQTSSSTACSKCDHTAEVDRNQPEPFGQKTMELSILFTLFNFVNFIYFVFMLSQN